MNIASIVGSPGTFLAKKPFFHLHQHLVFVQDIDIAVWNKEKQVGMVVLLLTP
jgi:hypothetical protein